MTDAEKKLWMAYDSAAAKVKDSKHSTSAVDEKNFGIAYQKLVKAGLAMQIKAKYR